MYSRLTFNYKEVLKFFNIYNYCFKVITLLQDLQEFLQDFLQEFQQGFFKVNNIKAKRMF